MISKTESYKQLLVPEKMPQHVAIIMDGNGRWAKKKNRPRLFGHSQGVKSVRNVVEASVEIGVKHLTLYAFSLENWNRPQSEVSGLMSLMISTIQKEFKTLHKNNVRIKLVGNLALLPTSVKEKVFETERITQNNTAMTLNIALSYGSQWEIAEAAKKIAIDVSQNKISPDDITPESFSQYLLTSHSPDPELLIRTSGEFRISNFLLYQMAYTELYFTDTLWPDFGKEAFYEAIYHFQQRERRFGKISEQLPSNSNQ
ncbi:MAG: isoprenyl transferase [Bacteroidetes bacterium HGW-Bacteroidetes-21]|nr:MAG: isoprenyl transferase [Bacteroidetes bacterium HGW-Bacteroidetes-21]